jgi:hypothetical protein
METVFIGFVLFAVGFTVYKMINKLFKPSSLFEQYADVIREVDKLPLLPKEAEVVGNLLVQEEPAVESTPKFVKKRIRKIKVDV